jgi:hypothetical protein
VGRFDLGTGGEEVIAVHVRSIGYYLRGAITIGVLGAEQFTPRQHRLRGTHLDTVVVHVKENSQ